LDNLHIADAVSHFSRTGHGRRKDLSWFKATLFVTAAFVSCGQALAQAPAQAAQAGQSDEGGGSSVFGDIIVTAQKRAESANKVGIAITAFSGDQLQSLGFKSSTDIVAMTPGVFNTADTGAQNRKFVVRGVSQNDFLDAVEAPVAVYIDETYVSAQQGQVFGLFDLERVEVLKGPQGTLFGRNATGGLVHFVSRKPEFGKTEGFIDLGYGSHDDLRAEAALTVPLGDSIAARVAGYYSRNDPYVRNIYPYGRPALNTDTPVTGKPDLGGQESWGLRGHLRFQPTETIDWLISGYGGRSTTSTGAYESEPLIAVYDAQGRQIDTLRVSATETREAIGPDGSAVDIFLDGDLDGQRPVPGGDLFGYKQQKLGANVVSHDFASKDFNRYTSYGATSNLKIDLSDAVSLTSITDWKHFDKNAALDAGGMPTSDFNFFATAKTDTIAQELRLNGKSDRMNWVAGLYYLNIDNKTRTGLPFLSTSFLATVFGPVESVTEVALKTKSYSIFGQADYALSDQFKVILGARAIREEKKFSFAQNVYLNQNDFALDSTVLLGQGTNPPLRQDTGQWLWAGKAQLEWAPRDRLLFYAGVNRGVKAGSFNGPLDDFVSTFAPGEFAYKPEVLVSYEAGVKAYLAPLRTQFNAAAYYYDYKDYQAFKFFNVTGTVTNAPATIKGFEIEATSNPTRGLDISASMSVIDAKVEDIQVAPGVFRDVKPVFTPKFQAAGLIRYGFGFLGGTLAGQFDVSHASQQFYNLRNFDGHTLDARTIGNVRVTWESEAKDWLFTLAVTNVWKEVYRDEEFDLSTVCGCSNAHIGKPRWVNASLRYSF